MTKAPLPIASREDAADASHDDWHLQIDMDEPDRITGPAAKSNN
jgi:hypothetical protein